MLKRVIHAPDRAWHSSRRRALLESLATRQPPRLILVVCHGNICRSPFAAAALRQAFKNSEVRVESAGFVGADRPVPPEAATVATALGIDLSPHRSRPMMPDVVAAADLIIVMDPAQQRAICAAYGRHSSDVIVLGDLDPEPIETRGIYDPVLQPVEIFKTVYTRIGRCVRALAAALCVSPAP